MIVTLRYVICNKQGHYMADLWNGKPTWSVAATDAILAGNAWLDMDTAAAKCRHCQEALDEPLSLSLVRFERNGTGWRAVSQEGVQ